jgi:hypothetical protein
MCEVANAKTNAEVKGDIVRVIQRRVGNRGERATWHPRAEMWNINSIVKLLYIASL